MPGTVGVVPVLSVHITSLKFLSSFQFLLCFY